MLQHDEMLGHRKGAGRSMKLSESDRISLGIKLRNQLRISLRTLNGQFKLARGDVSYESIWRTNKEYKIEHIRPY